MNEFFKVSVIVPIYNVERYIERCVRSLMEQTLDCVEYIFVDDASPDKSIDILLSVINSFPNKRNNIKLIHHTENKGLPAARNSGLQIARGEYIYHCDSDDYLDVNALTLLYNKAKENNVDIVWCDYFEIFPKKICCKKQPVYDTSLEAIKGMLIDNMQYNVWNKLVSRKLYIDNKIEFPIGYSMGEDLTMLLLFANATKFAYVPHSLYYYNRINPIALTSTMSIERFNALKFNVKRIEDYLYCKFGNTFDIEIATLKLNLKLPFLLSSKLEDYYKWNQNYCEANVYITRQSTSCRIKVLELCACRKQYWLIWLHYWLVVKLYYCVTGK